MKDAIVEVFGGVLLEPEPLVPRLTFLVAGRPQPQGSKKALISRSTGRAIVVDDCPGTKPWKQVVKATALRIRRETGYPVLAEAVALRLCFRRLRPRYHTHRSGLLIARYRDVFPIYKPDSTKLLRAVEDALTGVLYQDDGQVVHHEIDKDWGVVEGVEITVWPWRRKGRVG